MQDESGPIAAADGAWRLAVPDGVPSAQLDRWVRRGDRLAERAKAAVPVPPFRPLLALEGAEPGETGEGGTVYGGGSIDDRESSRTLQTAGPPHGSSRPRLAIVIDDWGYPWAAASDFLSLPVPLTVAVIPHLPLSAEHARLAEARGHQVILHLPMEPLNGSVPLEPNTVRVDMSPAQVLRILDRALASVPGAVGVNNHMGSKATAHPTVMHALLADLKRRGLFFLDSATTPHSVAPQAAEAHGLSFAVNRVFLDSDPSEEAVAERLRAAMGLALRTGEAVAIGHVRPQTYRALARVLPELQAAGIQLVHASELARPPRGPKGPGRALAWRIARDGRLDERLDGLAVALTREPAAESGRGPAAYQRPADQRSGSQQGAAVQHGPGVQQGPAALQGAAVHRGSAAQQTEHRVARERGDGR